MNQLFTKFSKYILQSRSMHTIYPKSCGKLHVTECSAREKGRQCDQSCFPATRRQQLVIFQVINELSRIPKALVVSNEVKRHHYKTPVRAPPQAGATRTLQANLMTR